MPDGFRVGPQCARRSGNKIRIASGIKLFEYEEERRVGQSDMAQGDQDPSTHTNYRGRATLIVNWVILAKQICQLRVSSWVRAQRLD